MFVDELIRAVFQILALSAIPFIWWLIAARKEPFFAWVGLKKPRVEDKKRFIIFVFVALIVAFLMSFVLDPILPDDIQLANERFRGQGISALIPAIIFAFFATALGEEILFRGFIGNRLCGKIGFWGGNTIQAVLFGLLHGATMFPTLGIAVPLLVIAFTATLGWLMGYINEKAGGSIIPSWGLHGASNLYAAMILAGLYSKLT
ncbi:MAG: CPBP family intramembrane metalloprotease [Oscillospiraceae bacterium]|nr:CPBP family intramembrane metalloprotease [Oscillospiraceae bacterium]